MARWSITAYAVEAIRASDGGLLDYAETDLDREVVADTAAEAVEVFHDEIRELDLEYRGEVFIECVKPL